MNVRDGYCYTDYFELVKWLGEISIKKISLHGETHSSSHIYFSQVLIMFVYLTAAQW